MKHTFAITIFEQRDDGRLTWTPLVGAGVAEPCHGKSEVRLRETLAKQLADAVRRLEPEQLELLERAPGTRLHHCSLDLVLPGRTGRVGGRFPWVLEPRWFTDGEQRLLVFHPSDPGRWFDVADRDELERLVPHFARQAWRHDALTDIEARRSVSKERLIVVDFELAPKPLLDRARAATVGKQRAGLGRAVHQRLAQLGVDQTARAIDGTLPLGVPRANYRAQLRRLLGGARPRSTILVGCPGSGRSTLLARWVSDRLDDDGWALHRNTDRIHRVWRLSGKRLIAGMQYFGDWEERLLDLVTDARRNRGLLWFDDLHLFGRLGRTRQSERSFADFFHGPVQRGELTIVASASREQLARLEDDAPTFANLFARVAVEPTAPTETTALLYAEVRRLEIERPVEVHPFTPRAVLELSGALFPWTAMPGAAIELLRKVVAAAPAVESRKLAATSGPLATERAQVGPDTVVAVVARETGLPAQLITLDEPLDRAAVTAHFAARVVGQDEAVAAATDLVVKVRAGLADPGRTLGVYLFTGPTGTGKTELATALAEYLYGDRRRLLRFDMSELAGPDAVARLIGDRFAPEGLLTSRIREQPFAVVLLDEIEKAHPSVLGLLLQLFDEGRLTDGNGDVASFRHAAVIMTSNLGARVAAPIGFADGADAVLGQIAKAVREFFPPELWNRIDQIVRFRPLTAEVAARVVDKELAKLLGRRGLRERDVFVYAGRAVRARAVAQAFDARFGARTVKRWLEDHVASSLADALIEAPPARMTVARLREHDGAIAVDLEQVPEAAPLTGSFPLMELRDASVTALAPAAQAMAARIDAALARDPLAASAGSPDAEVRYFVERYPDELAELRTVLDGRRRPSRSDDYEHHDLEGWRSMSRSSDRGVPIRPTASFDRRSLDRRGKAVVPQATLVEALARAELLLTHRDQLADPDAHAVTILVTTVGPVKAGMGWALLDLLHAAADHAMARDKDGRIAVSKFAGVREVQRGFVIRELFAYPAWASEHGTHFFQPLADAPEVYRVEVRRGAADLETLLADHARALGRFEAADADGGARPINPESLLPAVRTIRVPADGGRSEGQPYDVEDFVLGWSTRLVGRTPHDILRALWQVRWSRR